MGEDSGKRGEIQGPPPAMLRRIQSLRPVFGFSTMWVLMGLRSEPFLPSHVLCIYTRGMSILAVTLLRAQALLQRITALKICKALALL